MIELQEFRAVSKREGLPDLLSDPTASWMARHVEVQDAPAVVGNNKEAVQENKRGCWNGEEVHRGDLFAVVSQESKPTLRWFRLSGREFHPARNGSFGNVKAQHQELAMDSRSAPSRVFRHHTEY